MFRDSEVSRHYFRDHVLHEDKNIIMSTYKYKIYFMRLDNICNNYVLSMISTKYHFIIFK